MNDKIVHKIISKVGYSYFIKELESLRSRFSAIDFDEYLAETIERILDGSLTIPNLNEYKEGVGFIDITDHTTSKILFGYRDDMINEYRSNDDGDVPDFCYIHETLFAWYSFGINNRQDLYEIYKKTEL